MFCLEHEGSLRLEAKRGEKMWQSSDGGGGGLEIHTTCYKHVYEPRHQVDDGETYLNLTGTLQKRKTEEPRVPPARAVRSCVLYGPRKTQELAHKRQEI
jgi:hypothetical protein